MRATLKTDDGALIFPNIAAGSASAADGLHRVFTSPRYETGDPRYAWLNGLQCIGKGVSNAAERWLRYRLYAVDLKEQAVPAVNRQLKLARRPEGRVSLDDFRSSNRRRPQVEDGAVLARTLFLSVDPDQPRVDEGRAPIYAAGRDRRGDALGRPRRNRRVARSTASRRATSSSA